MTRKYILSGALLIGLLLSACDAHLDQPPNPDQLISKGKTLYVEQCAECHQTDGTGWLPLYPRLAGNPIVTLHDPEPIINTVLYGQGSMMSFRTKISGDDIAAILSYIRNAWGNQASAISPRQVH